MSGKFQSKSGLPEALGSTAHLQTPSSTRREMAMCDIPGCMTRRTGKQRDDKGHDVYLYNRGFGDVVIRTSDGKVHGHVCQKHYAEIITNAGKDQLSCVRQTQQQGAIPNVPLGYNVSKRAPQNLATHLQQINEQLDSYADSWDSNHVD